MTYRVLLGASLVAAGIAIASYNLLGPVNWLWPLGLVAAFWLYRREGRFSSRSLGLVVGALLLGFLLSAAPSSTVPPRASVQYVLEGEPWAELASLTLKSTSGTVWAGASTQPRAVVTYRKLQRGARLPDAPQLETSEIGGELTIVDRNWPLSERRDLSADVVLYLSPESQLSVRLDRGSVATEDLENVNISVGVGDVSIGGSHSASVRTSAGDISLRRASGEAQAMSSAGKITLDFGKSPAGVVSAVTGAGEVELRLPRGANVAVTAVSESGEVTGDFDEHLRPGEARLRLGQGLHPITLKSSAGKVKLVRKGY